ncbi:MarR family transcriptional regulator [Glaciimonas sp. GS1]|uniref:MarR family transcriptional regulator n=2 Tax=Glaciimonas soli TaxID=2590999 RepID=A0A843YNW0_9BURK|nr:MarR family transcriptional regulator [Glaciimonas soli]
MQNKEKIQQRNHQEHQKDGISDERKFDKVDTILAQWQRERPDLDSAPMGIIGRLGRLAHYFEAGVSEGLEQFGLTRWSFDVLAALRRAGAPYSLSPNALLQSLMITSGTMTNRIDHLERAALVVRENNPDDRRSVLITLTPAGLEVIEQAVSAHVANEHRLLASLKENEREQLAGLLRQLLLEFES